MYEYSLVLLMLLKEAIKVKLIVTGTNDVFSESIIFTLKYHAVSIPLYRNKTETERTDNRWL